MADIFVSYARADKARVAPLVAALEAQGFSVWWDPAINPGQEFDRQIAAELDAASAVIVVWTPQSVDSRWVRGEAREAADRGILVPVRFENARLPIDARSLHTTDLDDWGQDAAGAAFQDLLRAVKSLQAQSGAAPSSAAPGSTAPGNVQTPSTAPAPSAISPHNLKPWHIGALAATVLVAVLILTFVRPYDLSGGKNTRSETQATPAASESSSANSLPAAAAREPAEAGVSLAVLPFADMSPQSDQEYFSDGLAEELLNQLAQIKDLRVAGRTSSFSFKGKNEDLRTIGQQLGVNHLLEGSVRKSGTRLRITAQLINAADGSHLWSQSYDRELNDVFAVQEDIAKDVASALSITLGVGETARPTGGTSNVEANDKYLRARALASQLGTEELTKAVGLYRQAVTLDPDFALAWYGLYAALGQTLQYMPERAAATIKERSKASAHILALAPDTWWAKSVRLNQLIAEHAWTEAGKEAHAMLAAAPSSDSDAAFAYFQFVQTVGYFSESVEYLKRARQSDPLSLEISGYLQLMLDALGRYDEAQAEYERSADLVGNHARWEWFALLRMWARGNADPKAADAQFAKYLAEETLPFSFNQELAGKLGDQEAALSILRRAFNEPVNQDMTHLSVIGVWAAHYGDNDLALAALRRNLIDLKMPLVGGLWVQGQNKLRTDPRFKQLVRDLGLYDYWRASGKWADFCRPVGANDFECQ